MMRHIEFCYLFLRGIEIVADEHNQRLIWWWTNEVDGKHTSSLDDPYHRLLYDGAVNRRT